MTELQSKLQALRELVEAKTVECPRCRGLGTLPEPSRDIQPSPCDDCDGTGRIPDPAYAPLLEVILKPDWWPNSYGMKIPIKRLRSWDDPPRGALAGALRVALRPLSHIFPSHWVLWAVKDVDLTALEYVLDVLGNEAK